MKDVDSMSCFKALSRVNSCTYGGYKHPINLIMYLYFPPRIAYVLRVTRCTDSDGTQLLLLQGTDDINMTEL